MWALYLPSHIWLYGSLFLPFMILVRWGGANWRGLRWLTRGRKRWILIWGSYGSVKVIALATLLWARYFPEDVPFDLLGWTGLAVRSALFALHVRIDSLSAAYLLVASLSAIAEAAIHCWLAAIAWWVFEWTTQETSTHRGRVATQRYGVALLLSACLIGIANNLNFWRPVACYDCFRPHGVPFTFFHEGGFAGGEGFVWSGVIGDSLVVFLFAVVLGRVWNWLFQKRLIVHGITL